MQKRHDSYIPLHGHSTYSFGDGVTKLEDIMTRVKEIGADAVALTEHGNMSSFFKFHTLAKENNIKPILGCELYINDAFWEDKEKFLEAKRSKGKKKVDEDSKDNLSDEDDKSFSNNHFLTYARNYEGLKNIIHLSNIGFENFYRKPLVNSDLILEMLDDNNIITTGCVQSKFNQLILAGNIEGAEKLIKVFKDKFGDNFYFEIQFNNLDMQLKCDNEYIRLTKKFGIKPVFALDYHYAYPDDWHIQYLLYVIMQRQDITTMPEKDWFYSVRDLYIKDIDDVYAYAERLGFDQEYLELAIDSTFEIRDKVDVEIPIYPDNFPKFINSETECVKQFREKIKIGYETKCANGLIPVENRDKYITRMNYEIDIIIKQNMVNYFMILDDILANFVYATGGNTGAGRGSAGGSLVLFILDITKIDPVKHNLIFERFLNPARKDPADVDLDIDSVTQKGVENYLKEKYGQDKVCHISSFGKFGAKTIVKDLCRIFKFDYVLSNKLTSYFNSTTSDTDVSDQIAKALSIAKSQKDIKLVKFIEDNGEILSAIGSKFVGMVRQPGKHASGILVSNKTLNQSDLPVIRVKGDLVTGVQEGGDEREVGLLGYCKLDILGLTAASINDGTFKLITKMFDRADLENEILTSNLDDKRVYEEFCKGNCRDIFQFGSDSMIGLIKTVQPKNIVDLTAINALWRPAVIQAGGVDDYIANKKNPRKAELRLNRIHGKLWPILGETYGVPAFQEQIMFILQDVGGFTLAEADHGRKILKLLHKGNQEKNDDFNNMMAQFRNGALESGITEKNLTWLLDVMGKYSEYSFNKSHSFAYALNAYISMYLKIYYTKEYYSQTLNFSNDDDISWFIKEAKTFDVEFNDFTYGGTTDVFEVDYKNNTVSYGLNIVKGLSKNDKNKINNLKSDNLHSLIGEIHENKISKGSYTPLIRMKYFSKIFENSKVLEMIFLGTKSLKKKEVLEEKIDKIIEDNKDVIDYSKNEILNFEKKYLGFYISEHPFVAFQRYLKTNKKMFEMSKSPKEVGVDLSDGEYAIYGIVNKIEMKKSKKNGREYFKVILEDEEKQMYVTIFSSADVGGLNEGDNIIMITNKNKFGFCKKRETEIYKIKL